MQEVAVELTSRLGAYFVVMSSEGRKGGLLVVAVLTPLHVSTGGVLCFCAFRLCVALDTACETGGRHEVGGWRSPLKVPTDARNAISRCCHLTTQHECNAASIQSIGRVSPWLRASFLGGCLKQFQGGRGGGGECPCAAARTSCLLLLLVFTAPCCTPLACHLCIMSSCVFNHKT